MRRKLVDHYDLEEDIFLKGEEGVGNYMFKGGWSVMAVVADGAIIKGQIDDDDDGLELTLEMEAEESAITSLTYGVSILIATALAIF